MARFLFAVWPFAGHLHPALAIAHALERRGHDVAFYTGSAVRSVLDREGFRFFPFKKVDEERTTYLASSGFPSAFSFWSRLRSARQARKSFQEWMLDTVPQQVEDIDEIFEDWRPDVILCDLAFWSPILVYHETRGIPVAVLSVLAACILPGPDAPLWGLGLPRPKSTMTRLRSRASMKVLDWLATAFRADVNALRRRYGLPPLRVSVTEFAARMPLYLVPSIPAYDYERRDLPASVHYVGPCLWDKPENNPPPHWLAELPPNRPLIYVTEATIGTTEPFLLRAAAEGLKDLPVNVVMTTGKQRNPAELGLVGDATNVRVDSYIPHSDLLPRTSVMVTLGGSGGVLAALKAGVPLVISPTEWDRPENAQRVVEAGAGIRIPPQKCTPARVREAVQRVLDEPSFQKNAQRLADAFSQYDGPSGAAQLLEKVNDVQAARQPAEVA